MTVLGLHSHISAPINVKFGTRELPVPNFTFIGATCRPCGVKTHFLKQKQAFCCKWAVSWSPRRYLLYVLCQKNRQKFENLMPRGSKTIHRTKQVHQQDKVAILGVHYPRRGATPPLWLTFLESCRRSDVKIDMQRCDLPLSRYSVFTGQNFGFWGSPAGGIAPNGENSLPIRPVPICTIMQNHFTPIGATIAEISSQKTGHRIGDSPGEGATVPCYTFLESRRWVELMLSSNWHGTLRLTVF